MNFGRALVGQAHGSHTWSHRRKIREVILPLIELAGVVLPGKNRLRKVFDLYVDLNISFADAYHAVLMESLKLDEIITFDAELDRVPGIERQEPRE